MRTIHCALALAALAACGNEAEPKNPPHAHAPAPKNAAVVPVRADADAMAEFGGGRVPLQLEACKAALAVLTGAAPRDIEGRFVAGTLAEVSRPAPNDALRGLRCRADTPSGLSWIAMGAEGDASQVRWRNGDRITFSSAGDTLKIVVARDGATQEGSYRLDTLRTGGK